MNEFENNGQQGNGQNMNNQPNMQFNDQPNGQVNYTDNQYNGNQYGANQYDGNQGNPYGAQQYSGAPYVDGQYNPNMGQPAESKGLSIAALSCGVAGILCNCINTWLAIILAIAAIILGAIGRKKGARKMGTAGMICGIVNIVLIVLLVLLVIMFGFASIGALSSLS